MDDKHHEVTIGIIGGIIVWILGECISTWLHVKMMKKEGFCPFAVGAKRITPKKDSNSTGC